MERPEDVIDALNIETAKKVPGKLAADAIDDKDLMRIADQTRGTVMEDINAMAA